MVDFAAACKQLRVEVETLKEENRQLRDLLTGGAEIPWDWQLSRSQAAIMRCLIARAEVSYGMIEAAIYHDRDPPDDVISVIRSQMRFLRQKLKSRNIEIHNKSGFGFYLDPATRRRLQTDLKPRLQPTRP